MDNIDRITEILCQALENKTKPYFSKILPLENGYKRVVKNAQGIPIDYEYEVGMFLCTRDGIKSGDEIFIPKWYMSDHEMYKSDRVIVTSISHPQKGGSMIHYKAECTLGGTIHSGIPLTDTFKIVGQILSPGIIEGQKFTEKEIEYLTIKQKL